MAGSAAAASQSMWAGATVDGAALGGEEGATFARDVGWDRGRIVGVEVVEVRAEGGGAAKGGLAVRARIAGACGR